MPKRPAVTPPDPTSLADLTPDPKNARKHSPRNVGTIVDALHEVGAARSIVIDENGVILAGNATCEAAGEAGITKVQVVDADGQTIVAVRRTGLTPQQKAKLALYDNRAAELADGWDAGVLGELAAELDLSKMFSADELAELLGQEPTAGLTDPDAVPDERPTDIKLGDLFQLGDHRLLCGDSTKAEDVARVMGGEKAGLMNTDPPYGVAYANDSRPNPGVAKPRVANDERLTNSKDLGEFLTSVFLVAKATALVENAAWYVWFGNMNQNGTFLAAAAAAGVALHRQIVWVKPVLLLGRGQYHWKHEPCFMGWLDGHQPPDYGRGKGERDQTTIWEVSSINRAERKELNHSTPKPVGLFTIPIIKHLRSGEICYEPFAGSGPQFIAAEQCGMRCFGIELHPLFVQTIIDRWEQFTGKTAVKVAEAVAA